MRRRQQSSPETFTSPLSQRRRSSLLEQARVQLSSQQALALLVLFALIIGICAGLVVIGFRQLSEGPAIFYLPQLEDFESLSPAWRFGLPVSGALVLGLFFHWVAPSGRPTGVVHVLDRLHNHQGRMPTKNAVLQFFGGALALLSGQSIGREGPSVHLGAATGSWIAKRFRLPDNSARTLLACGVAAAIAASFNTPLAGVIFAMEVVMLEYTVAGFLPVMIAAVVGSAATRLAFGHQAAFDVPASQLESLAELPILFVSALLIGALASLFIISQRRLVPLQQKHSPLLRFLVAGTGTGLLALWVPEILGAGYDTLELAMLGQLSIAALSAIVLAKLVATALATGLGIPGGVIGPSLILGACIGGAAAHLANLWLGAATASPGLYAMVGMAAMMAALLNAPLAALLTILELTYNPNVLFPAMMTIVIACLVSRQLFGSDGIYQESLRALGKSGTPSWRAQMLSRVGVASVMERAVAITPQFLERAQAERLIEQQPAWLLVGGETTQQALRTADLANFLQRPPKEGEGERRESKEDEKIDLMRLPGERLQLAPLSWRATLLEAQQQLEQQGAGALYVGRDYDQDSTGILNSDVAGIILPQHIEHYYRQ
ncbi:chloride channel protein [Microbulbifer hydrolyticus]|uniref:Chloride channel protein n=1 Tax=Microbulbifer hydrolyticus TaxID=48074 RepID=A0A6P1TC10_9GAMM|nr:chloride channel protein [Microbulbifer hydrolyticus]MBB5212938.1 H+/Cl- antiporter ClcA [Microbulbifer hydrolyticus]QHQ40308.1 chloride channel protein [Microbulbifer hydrolyticus]